MGTSIGVVPWKCQQTLSVGSIECVGGIWGTSVEKS
jgi:hypothetical protein